MTMHPSMENPQSHGNMYSSPAPPPIHSVSPMARHSAPPYTSAPLELKVHEINKRLRQRPDYPDRWWWDQFALEFFDDTATMLISFYSPGEGEKHFTIGRAMIPQYFSSIFEGGVSEMYYTFSFPREYMSHSGPTIECDNVLTTTQYHQPSYARVLVESRLSFQCTFDETMRIRSWNQYIIRHKEYVPRDIISLNLQESGSVNSLLPNITLLGINNCTLSFLNVSAISDSIRPDVKYNTNGMMPNDCMGQNWGNQSQSTPPMMNHHMNHPPMSQQADYTQSPVMSNNADSINSPDRLYPTKSPKPAKKQKRPRKGSTIKESPAPKKMLKNLPMNMPPQNPTSSPLHCAPISQQDVMIVGEPILMGGELGDGDERRITRLENNNNSELLSSSQHHDITSTILNGDVGDSNGLSLDLNDSNGYDEPSISAALDALEQDSNSLTIP